MTVGTMNTNYWVDTAWIGAYNYQYATECVFILRISRMYASSIAGKY